MARSRRDLLEVLKLELEFLHNGGYRQFSWGPSLIFEDSPTCLNYGYSEYSRPCSVCALMQLVPVERRRGRVPCRHIPLNEQNETIQSLYLSGTSENIEAQVVEWLMEMIQRLEVERAGDPSGEAGMGSGGRIGTA
jgi:hypothetical protein